MLLLLAWIVALAALQGCSALTLGGKPGLVIRDNAEKRELLQDIITWDEHSIFVRGERIMVFSGEFHPFRLPVPGLWLDIFQKIKALGYNCVSFYTYWALLEGKPGEFTAEGVFALEPFFEAASEAGVYLLARPGPYINAEVSGGGFPGWLQRVKGQLRTPAADYLAATDNYMANIASIIAAAQITNGGPVILYQPENEYSIGLTIPFPNVEYFQYVEDQARSAGIVVPLISNDAFPGGHDVPGSGEGEVDIYGHDSYPLGFDCANPTSWPLLDLPVGYHALHELESPSTPYSIVEFQGGSYDSWAGAGYDSCAALLNEEFERVFYKNNYAAGVALQNIYMTYGGTNWGNTGQPSGYTSYDYGSAIKEDRTITREKYSEAKLQAQFLKVSPAYLTASPGEPTLLTYSPNLAITITALLGNESATNFFIVRHTIYSSTDSTSYSVTLPTSAGTISIPQLGGSLTLNGRDSKIHVTDYDVAGTNLLYSTSEIFTWKQFESSKVLIMYGGAGEMHEVAVGSNATFTSVEGNVTAQTVGSAQVFQWTASSTRQAVQFGDLTILLLDRNTAYNYWVSDLPSNTSTPAFANPPMNTAALIIKAGYLVRSVFVTGSTLAMAGDFNATTSIEIFGVPSSVTQLTINSESTAFTTTTLGSWETSFTYTTPSFSIPSLSSLTWKVIDALPEIQSSYNDSLWTLADNTTTSNSANPLLTPVSLYGSDYGFNVGTLIYRGTFTATGSESSILLTTQGGDAFAAAVYLNSTFIGSYTGASSSSSNTQTYDFPNVVAGAVYTLTIVIDNTGLEENYIVGLDLMKTPRGITFYELFPLLLSAGDISWKMTGNLGGESYVDKTRGPMNEGGFFPERQGYHQPSPPSDDWDVGTPMDGFTGATAKFYTTAFDLDMPGGYDTPLSVSYTSGSNATAAWRAMLYVNGWQFGKIAGNIGPQTSFPVPEGIWNYRGSNTVAVLLWALTEDGANMGGLELVAGTPVVTSMSNVTVVDSPVWTQRTNSY